MNSDSPILLIQDLAVILIAAALAGSLSKRLKLSPIVGYLLAGIVIGTPQITFIYVTDPIRIKLLSQLGLVFLMFSIGLSFRVQRFKQLGLGLIIACLITALLVLTGARLAGGWLGLSPEGSLFLAAMLMISSSAVIGKNLQSQGLIHQRHGQLALGITLCEDIVAIILLAFLGSYAALDPGAASNWLSVPPKVGSLLAFAALLLVPGLILVPRLLRRVSAMQQDSQELETIIVAGLLFGMAFLTLVSGYSLALGSFLCGMMVAESSRVKPISDSFAAMRDVFVAVFFVAIGMAVDVTRFPDALGLIVTGTLLALLLRPLAAACGLLVACEDPKTAAKAGLCLTPIGEFSFVIANLGVAVGLLDQTYQIASVGIAFITALISPWLLQGSDRLSLLLDASRISLLDEALAAYRRLWSAVFRRQDSSLIWRILKPRIPQVAAELLFASAILLFSRPIYLQLLPTIESTTPTLQTVYQSGYWILIAILVLAPVLALARNINALAMILGEFLTQGLRATPALRDAFKLLIRTVGLLCLGLWIANLIPFSWLNIYALAGICLAVVLALALGWRQMVRLHSEAAFSLRQAVSQEGPAEAETRALQEAKVEWGIDLEEWTLGSSAASGRSISDLQLRKRTGATIVGIERQGHYLPSIGPETHLFPGDRIFATGSPDQLASLRQLLARQTDEADAQLPDYRAAILDTVLVEPGAPCVGQTLRSLQWPRLIGVQVVAMKRQDQTDLNPRIDDPLQPGDALLLVGSPRALATAATQLQTPPPPAPEEPPASKN